MVYRTPWTIFLIFCISSWSSWLRILKLSACLCWFQSPLWQWATSCISGLPRKLWAPSFLPVVVMIKKLQMQIKLILLTCRTVQLLPPLDYVTRLCRAHVCILFFRIPINCWVSLSGFTIAMPWGPKAS